MKSFVFIVTMKITTCVLLGLLTICFARPAEGKIHSSKFCIKNNCISIVILLQSCFKQLYLFIDNEIILIFNFRDWHHILRSYFTTNLLSGVLRKKENGKYLD